MIRKIAHTAFVLLALIGLTACGDQAPDTAEVQQAVETRLSAAFPEPALEIASIKRLGSGILPAETDETERRIVYYNARMKLTRDYAFGDWEALNPAALANLMGATEHGITGIEPNGNQAGDELLVRGSVTFQQTGDTWQPVAFVPPPSQTPPPPDNTGPPAVARNLVSQIMDLFEGPPGGNTQQARSIITQELDDAYRQITLRLDRLQRAFVIAGGPEGGEYNLVARIIAAANTAAGVRSASITTEGSVENLRLLRDGSADVVLAQNDIAAMAHQGHALFEETGPDRSLRALASLFPEPVHFVVRADGPIRSVSDLRGKRVDLGLPDSGSRLTALAVLDAHGLTSGDLASIADTGPVRAAAALTAGEIDAFVTVINAPARLLQRLDARPGIRLLPLADEALQTLTGHNGNLMRLTLPAGTYPNQNQPIPTVAVTALLVGRDTMPDVEVEATLRTVFEKTDFLASGSTAGALISRNRARSGLSIPPHPAAESYLVEATSSLTQ